MRKHLFSTGAHSGYCTALHLKFNKLRVWQRFYDECVHSKLSWGQGQKGGSGGDDEAGWLERGHGQLPWWWGGQGPTAGLDQAQPHSPGLHQKADQWTGAWCYCQHWMWLWHIRWESQRPGMLEWIIVFRMVITRGHWHKDDWLWGEQKLVGG